MKSRSPCHRRAARAFFTVVLALAPPRITESHDEGVPWIWSGAVTPSSIRIKAKVVPGSRVRLQLSHGSDPTRETYYEPVAPPTPQGVVSFEPTGLLPGTRYRHELEVDGRGIGSRRGSFRTLETGAFSFKLAFASCAQTGSQSPVFLSIRRHDPLIFLHLGDLHYENLNRDEPRLYREAFDRVLSSSTQSVLFRGVPTVYLWDDHDFGPNNADRNTPGRRAARQVYQEVVPHYPLAAGAGDVPIYHAFTVGRVRFVVTDMRSEKSPRNAPDDEDKTVLGSEQKRWFANELQNASHQHALVVWVSSLPWIAPCEQDADHWGGYCTERRELARLVSRKGVPPLVMLAGDAHMIAIDDGTNNRYGDEESQSFPVFHAGPLDRRGSVKGGPYSHGSYPERGQFGLMEVHDDGQTIRVEWSGRNASNEEIVALSWTAPEH